MRNLVIGLIGLVALVGIGLAVWGGSSSTSTDADSELVRLEAPPEDFPLAPLPAAEGTFLTASSREVSGIKTVTVQYALAEGVDEDGLLERYANLMASERGTPVRNGLQVRAARDGGLMTAQIVEGKPGRVLTLVAVKTP
ncbi:MAG: hypothetical protein AAGA48_20330 [Myxococcota bacterium]